ncbi:helix-turn-helix domain-containing protein [Dyadobacter tibetensis]|uniref:helix-turn-helix domain-containing protein n=1 Tax=Dyadobacter tibetensis TaxID=1211851 RepID=UPI00046F858E|nr:AraC family transcriptional regulator [Dyadobacter tibetensis]
MKPILEPIYVGDQRSIVSFHYKKRNFETPWHFHPQHELTYIEESLGTKFIGDYVGPYRPGELVLLRSNLPHCWKNSSNQKHDAQSFVVQWDLATYPKVPELAPIHDLLKAAAKGIIFDHNHTEPVIKMVKRLPELDGHFRYLFLLKILITLTECPYQTLSEASFINDLPSEYGNRMAKIHEFVEQNFHRKIYLNELADLVSMSEQSFSRFFTKMMGRPFFAFLNEYRINIATRMLLDSDASVSQIGFACGYESLPFFHKKFSELHGLSPMKYRQRH